MKTPPRLKGLIGALTAVEKACEGTDWEWTLYRHTGGYTASIGKKGSAWAHTFSGATPAGALSQSLAAFNLRIKEKP